MYQGHSLKQSSVTKKRVSPRSYKCLRFNFDKVKVVVSIVSTLYLPLARVADGLIFDGLEAQKQKLDENFNFDFLKVDTVWIRPCSNQNSIFKDFPLSQYAYNVVSTFTQRP